MIVVEIRRTLQAINERIGVREPEGFHLRRRWQPPLPVGMRCADVRRSSVRAGCSGRIDEPYSAQAGS